MMCTNGSTVDNITDNTAGNVPGNTAGNMTENTIGKFYGLIGEKLGHSFSKEIHESLAGYEYRLCPLSREEFAPFMERADFAAINVTIPYKEMVIPYLAEIDPRAAAIGAVNTIVNRGGRLCGYNTDFDGVKYLLARHNIDLRGRRVLVLGTGGTSKTVCAVAGALGAASCTVVSRSGGEGRLNYTGAAAALDTQVIINTTPNGMYPHNGDAPLLDPAGFPRLEAVADVVYNPLQTNIVLAARELGVKTCGGLEMLVAQAKYAAELFTGRQIDDAVIDDIYRHIRREKLNIALIGMPGSGKSTVGRLLAEALGREFVDCDRVLEERAGREISDIFRRDGEEAFRGLESEVLLDVASRGGRVIATGGGIIKKAENIRVLRQNSLLVFLDRDPQRLDLDPGRPLSQSVGDNMKLYKERYPIYTGCADYQLQNNGTAGAAVAALAEYFKSV